MKKIKLFTLLISLITAVGISYAIFALKNIPDAFDFEDSLEEEEC